MKSEVYKRKLESPDEFLARNLDAAARIKKREDQLRRTARYIRIRDMKSALRFTVVFENLFRTLKALSFVCNKFVI